MAYTTAIFDMDGTILDTLDDLADSVNYALALHDMPASPRPEVRQHLGNGMDYLIAHSVPAGTPHELEQQILAEFKADYAKRCVVKTAPYPGILDLMGELRRRGIRRAVVSNKGDFAVQELVERYFPGVFDAAVGEREGVRRKPAPDTVEAVMSQLGVGRDEVVYVGDSEVDLATARNTGIDCIAVDWGFRDRNVLVGLGAPVIVSDTDQLLAQICRSSD
ncbi:MAG: HAD family hydrolase [Olegusella sp.]|nr:HAD family hydrolase [Olegusella sp.]